MLKHLYGLYSFRLFFFAAIRREIKSRYLNSVIGAVWLLLNPVLQLVIYYFVFEKIFQIKFHALAGQDFISFVALGLWPWVAFSEGLLSGTNAIDKHKDLLRKMSVPRALLVLIEVTVPYVIHFLGFIFILLILSVIFGQTVYFLWLPVVAMLYLVQLFFCFGLSLVLSALQVFLKDIVQLLTPIVMVWFYLTPIIYPEKLIPDGVRELLALNPLTGFIATYRHLLLENHIGLGSMWTTIAISTLLFTFLGYLLFHRLSKRFEDMF